MSTDQYKKSYEGDYTKSYKNYITWKIENQTRKQEYDTISKKLNDIPYNKQEHSSDYSASTRSKESERVYADGRGNKRERGQIKRNWNDESSYSSTRQQTRQTTTEQKPIVEAVPEIEIVEDKKVETQYVPPIFQEIKENPKPWKNAYEVEEEENDENYNYFDYPIEEIGFEKYRNLKTKKEIGLEEARKVLQIAGYEPKPNNNIGIVILMFFGSNVVLPYFAPIVAIVYGLFRMKIKTTTWMKGAGKQVYKFSLPATDGEIAGNQIVGKIAIGIGVITAFVRYANMI